MKVWIQRGQTTKQPISAQTLTAFLSIFAALGTIFVLIVSIMDGIREHSQQSWPQATATIEQCSVDQYVPLRSRSRNPVWHIRCRIGYWTDFGQIKTGIQSGSTGSLWGGHLEEMQKWVARHPPGSSIVVRYDPKDPKTAVLTATDMPEAGPRTPDNLKLLLIAGGSYAVLVGISKWLRSRPQPQ